MGNLRLKDFIRAIRACKTAADERAVIARESAAIRTSFKEETSIETRHINISKLLYIHMLGYPAHFGQIECLKLVAGGKYPDKRLGYLGIMLLLDESQEVLTLVTNSLKNDMNSSNMYNVGLALCTMGNIASAEMSRDLAPEVEKLMASSNSYVKKKAALCAIKIIRKVPDLSDIFAGKVAALLQDRNHAVVLAGVSLMTDLCAVRPALIVEFRQQLSNLIRCLKSLLSTGSAPEFDVNGINDPFLQVKILRFLRILCKGDKASSDSINDVLAQIATNTESSKNVGNSILYEACLTIMEIEADNGLRVLAINILGRFLANQDNNIRYVALNTLAATIAVDVNAVQRHRATILNCLHDNDVSIKRRALELCFYLINESNVRVMVRELLTFLETADIEFKTSMPARICAAADQFAPNKRWHIDTILRVFKSSGNYVKEEVVSNFIKLVASVPEFHAYAGYKLYYYMKQDLSQEALVVSGVWCLGEYADVLLQSNQVASFDPVNPEDAVGGPEESMKSISEKEVLDLLEQILESPYNNTLTTEYVITALAKLTVRVNDASCEERAKRIIMNYTSNVDLELQQRSVEYSVLLNDPSVSKYRSSVLAKMPVPPPVDRKLMQAVSAPASGNTAASPATGTGNLLDDLLSLNTGASFTSPTQTGAVADIFGGLGSTPAKSSANVDVLADVFGGLSTTTAATKPAVPKTTQDILGLFGSSASPALPSVAIQNTLSAMSSNPVSPGFGVPVGGGVTQSFGPSSPMKAIPQTLPTPVSAPPSNAGVVAYQKNQLTISFSPTAEQGPSPTSRICSIKTVFKNEGPNPISDVLMLIAVPKTLQLQMLPASGNFITSGGSVTQDFKVLNEKGGIPEGSAIAVKLRLKLSYVANGTKVEEVVDFPGFPSFGW